MSWACLELPRSLSSTPAAPSGHSFKCCSADLGCAFSCSPPFPRETPIRSATASIDWWTPRATGALRPPQYATFKSAALIVRVILDHPFDTAPSRGSRSLKAAL